MGFTVNKNNSWVTCGINYCVSCSLDEVCDTCIENAELSNNKCKCKNGYQLIENLCVSKLTVVDKEPADDKSNFAYLGIGVAVGLTLGLACIGIIVLIKKIQSAGSIIPSQSLATN